MSAPIVAAACEKDGLVYSMPAPHRHHHILRKMFEAGGRALSLGCNQGFIDAAGFYLDRESAAKRVIEVGQLEKTQWGASLFSEDLW